MARAQPQPYLTAADYLAWEQAQADRHEYIDGEVFAMAGGEDRHTTTAGNLYIALRQHLRGTPCSTYMSDVRLHVAASNAYFYPDVMVTCDSGDRASRLSKSAPVLVAEVLSPSTASYDVGAKFAHYRQIASLREYVLVDIDRRSADVYRKGADGLWVLHPFSDGQAVGLASVELTLPAADLFADLEGEDDTAQTGR
ncbi:MAG: Uma2 family endonuclease [Acidovorax sp.]|uniref:Uma2 family endonuclease n=1 Tax=Acidovorax sp. TaxID=1872122 RepID=UPI0039E52DAA